MVSDFKVIGRLSPARGHILRFILLCLVCLLTTSCVDVDVETSFNADGSGMRIFRFFTAPILGPDLRQHLGQRAYFQKILSLGGTVEETNEGGRYCLRVTVPFRNVEQLSTPQITLNFASSNELSQTRYVYTERWMGSNILAEFGVGTQGELAGQPFVMKVRMPGTVRRYGFQLAGQGSTYYGGSNPATINLRFAQLENLNSIEVVSGEPRLTAVGLDVTLGPDSSSTCAIKFFVDPAAGENLKNLLSENDYFKQVLSSGGTIQEGNENGRYYVGTVTAMKKLEQFEDLKQQLSVSPQGLFEKKYVLKQNWTEFYGAIRAGLSQDDLQVLNEQPLTLRITAPSKIESYTWQFNYQLDEPIRYSGRGQTTAAVDLKFADLESLARVEVVWIAVNTTSKAVTLVLVLGLVVGIVGYGVKVSRRRQRKPLGLTAPIGQPAQVTAALAPRQCPRCQGSVSAQARFCKHCGNPMT